MQIINVSTDNIDKEHICCAISGNKNQEGISLKKIWLKERFKEGLRFKKYDIRGKVFIEYLPAEFAWRPILAPGYIFIHCLWVSGKYKGQGLGKSLLEECLKDAKGTNGVAVVTSKQSYLTDKKFFERFGFEQVDSAPPYFELMVKKFNINAPNPQFCQPAKILKYKDGKGLTFIYTDQCPFTNYYVDELANVGINKGLKIKKIRITNHQAAQQIPSAYGTFNVFLNEEFLTHKIVSAKTFEKMLEK